MIHIRALENGIHDYKQVIDNVSEILRPGGVLLLASVGMYAFDEEKRLLPWTVSGDGTAPSALGGLFNALRGMFRWDETNVQSCGILKDHFYFSASKGERLTPCGCGRIGLMRTLVSKILECWIVIIP